MPQQMPELYERWLTESLRVLPPREERADCSRCPMCEGRSVPLSIGSFSDQAKCCTFVPDLPSYLVGHALCDKTAGPRGRETIEARLTEDVGVIPLGILKPPLYQLSYSAVSGHRAFGRADAMRCPHYLIDNGGTCGIWQSRNAVCATWFCKYSRGSVGWRLWRALEAMLLCTERRLPWWVCEQLTLDEAAVRHLRAYQQLTAADRLAVDMTGEWHATSARLWGNWRDAKREFFERPSRLLRRCRGPRSSTSVEQSCEACRRKQRVRFGSFSPPSYQIGSSPDLWGLRRQRMARSCYVATAPLTAFAWMLRFLASCRSVLRSRASPRWSGKA